MTEFRNSLKAEAFARFEAALAKPLTGSRRGFAVAAFDAGWELGQEASMPTFPPESDEELDLG